MFDDIAGDAGVREVQGAFNKCQAGFIIVNFNETTKQLSTIDGLGLVQVRTVKKRAGNLAYEIKAVGGASRGMVLANDYSSAVHAFELAYNYAVSQQAY